MKVKPEAPQADSQQVQDLPVLPVSLSGITTTYAPGSKDDSWGNTILFGSGLEDGQDGFIGYVIADKSCKWGMIGFKEAAEQGNYTTFNVGLWNDDYGSLAVIDNGNINQQAAPYLLGDAVAVGRTNGKWSVQRRTGGVWQQAYPLNYHFTGKVTAVADIRGDGKMCGAQRFVIVPAQATSSGQYGMGGDSQTEGLGVIGAGPTGSGIHGPGAMGTQLIGMLGGGIADGHSGYNAVNYLAEYADALIARMGTGKRVVGLWFGTNDILQSKGDVQAVCEGIAALHKRFRDKGILTVAGLVLNRMDACVPGGFPFNAYRMQVNDYILNHLQCDAVARFDLVPELYAENAPMSPKYFNPLDPDNWSWLHITDAGSTLAAQCFAAPMKQLMNS